MNPTSSILSQFGPALAGLRWHRASGGFSGADVWRGDDDSGRSVIALKAWPHGFPPSRLSWIHSWLARAAHLPFIPSILQTRDGIAIAADSGRIWDATQWMPGASRIAPSPNEVEAACTAIARLHRAWSPFARRAICPGVSNRLRVLRNWLAKPIVPETNIGLSPNLNSLLKQAASAVRIAAPSAVQSLEPWESSAFRVQPCVRDLRGEHVLFIGDAVSGIVDFGALAEDHPATDLSRVLGDFASGNEALFEIGLISYRRAGGELIEGDEFVRILARTGTLCSLIMWLIHLCIQRRTYPETSVVETRLDTLIRRIEPFAPT